jgi:hypothetical protein
MNDKNKIKSFFINHFESIKESINASNEYSLKIQCCNKLFEDIEKNKIPLCIQKEANYYSHRDQIIYDFKNNSKIHDLLVEESDFYNIQSYIHLKSILIKSKVDITSENIIYIHDLINYKQHNDKFLESLMHNISFPQKYILDFNKRYNY